MSRERMTPEQMAAVRADLDSNPRVEACIRHARLAGARLAAEGIASCRIAGHLSALGLGVDITDEISAFFAETVRQSASRLRLAMYEAAEAIAYDIAAYLDARAPSATIREIAGKAAGPLSPDQVDAIVKRETAWWVRLHAQLERAA